MKNDRENWRLLDLMKTAEQFLQEKGIENSRGNAEALLGKALNLPRIELYLHYDRPLTAEEIGRFRELVRRRLNREPLQIILGQVEFFGATIQAVTGLLVPRPETEEMTAYIADCIKAWDTDVIRILDIGCGSGCISVSLAMANRKIQATAVDIDALAISTTNSNARLNAVGNRVKAIHADLFSDVFTSLTNERFDVVVMNPPYIEEKELHQLQPEVRDFEPRHALVAERQGLAYYERLSEILETLIVPGGLLAAEFGKGQESDAAGFFESSCESLEIHKDMSGISRFLTAKFRGQSS